MSLVGGRSTNSKSLRLLLATALLLFYVLPGTAFGAVWTDQQDYTPGSVVTISGDNSNGAGYMPGEAVHVTATGPNGFAWEGDAVADDTGAWSLQLTLWDDERAVGEYSYTSVGQVSGVTETGGFTDAANAKVWAKGPIGTTFTLTYATYSSADAGGSVVQSGTILNVKIGGGGDQVSTGDGAQSMRLTAPVNSNQGGVFVRWESPNGASLTTQRSVVVNLTWNGQQDYHAVYEAAANTNVDPAVGAFAGGTVSEGSTYTSSGSFADAGPAPWAATVNYGDGSGVQALTLNSDKTFALAHTYADNGSYSVAVVVTDAGGLSGSRSALVTVNNVIPVVDAGPDATIDEGSAFSSSGSFTDPGADTWSATVDYGDGSGVQPLGLNPDETFALSHTYADNGVYTVTVTVTDDDGGVGSDTAQVTVDNVIPTVDAGPDAIIDEGSGFSSSGSFTDPGADTWSATVNYGDGSAVQALTLNLDKTFALSHTYADNGVYTVTVTVTDDDGGVDTDAATALVTVNNVAPVVDAGSDATIDEGSAFSSSGSFTDPGADTWSASVDYGDGSGVQTLSLNPDKTFDLSHTYADNGVYTVTVTVTDDDDGVGTDTAEVTVRNVAPTLTAKGDQIDENQTATVAGTITDPGVLDSFTVVIDWGEGTPETFTYPAGSTSFSQTHHYLDDDPTGTPSDDYAIAVTVTDKDGGAGTAAATVTVDNVAPMADAGPAQAGGEPSTFTFTGSFTDPGTLDTHTYQWDFDYDGTTFDVDDTGNGVSHTWLDDFAGTVALRVTDDDTGAHIDTAQVTVWNVAPVVDAGSDATIDEGSAFSSSGSFTDPGADTWSASVDYGDGSGVQTLSLNPDKTFDLSHTYADNGVYTVTVTVTDDDDGVGTDTAEVTVRNVAPTLDAITGPPGPVPVGNAVSFSAPFTDPGTVDTFSGSWDFGDGSTANFSGLGPGGSGTVTVAHTYTLPGIYTVNLILSDDDGGVATREYQYVVVYDPNGGFVTGGGWINSPEGAYVANPSLTGKANFGFNSAYKKGATVPTGQTQFQFQVGNLNFHSSSYDWLVVAGTRAQYKGTGTINGTGSYGFMLTAIDNGTSGDQFRMKIWDSSGMVIYDNKMGAADSVSSLTALAGGSIVIHAPNKK